MQSGTDERAELNGKRTADYAAHRWTLGVEKIQPFMNLTNGECKMTTLQQKIEQAKHYLDQRGINRARVECNHRFDPARHQAPPRFDVSRSGNQVKQVPSDE